MVFRRMCMAWMAGAALAGASQALANHDEDDDWEDRFLPQQEAPLLQAHVSARPLAPREAPAPAALAADYALGLIGVPYRDGGSVPSSGFDCSGLVQFSFGQAGVQVPRNTDEQRRASRPVRVSELKRGDLLFFHELGKKSSHVGLYLGQGQFVHAATGHGAVRTDRLDARAHYWRKHLSEARRFDL